MKRLIIGICAVLLATGVYGRAMAGITPGAAPADEYFGRRHESILEIRNRLDRLEARPDVDQRMLGEMDSIAGCLLDWQQQYPADPWVPHAFVRLLVQYHRIQADNDPRAMRLRRVMETAYGGSNETRRMEELLAGQNDAHVDTGDWQHFDASRDGDGGGG